MTTEKVKVEITADGSKVKPVVDRTSKEIGSLGSVAKGVGDQFTSLGAKLAGALSVGAFTAFLSKVNTAIGGLDDLSQRLQGSASGIQTLQVAAAQAGGSTEAMSNALARMSVSLGDALAGNKLVNDSLSRLGLTAKELSGLKTDEAMRRISTALSEMPNSFDRASTAQAIFGKGAKELGEFFATAPDAIGETEAALRDAGAALDDIDVARIGAMNDDLQLQGVVVQNLGAKFLSGLAPAIGVATGTLTEMLGKVGGATEAGNGFGVAMVAAIKLIETAAYSLIGVFETVRAVISGIVGVLAAGVEKLLGGIAYIAEKLGSETAGPLRQAQEVMSGISTSLFDVSASARQNAQAAGKAAIEAATNIVRAGEIFAAAQVDYEARAAAAAGRAQGGQGEVSDATLAIGEKAGKEAKDPFAQQQQGALRAIDKAADKTLAQFDPTTDVDALVADARNRYLQEQYDAHAGTMIGKLEAFNDTWLGSMLSSNQTQIDSEAYKNQTIGDMMGTFVNVAVQQGGTLGKVGKAFAIAQTIWSTATAVMNAMAQVPYPANIGVAAAAAVMGVAQLANIKKTNIGSGGSVTSAKGGASASTPSAISSTPSGTQQSTESQEKSATQIVINGNLFAAQETVDWLVEQIGEAINGRDMVFINGNSRQAMELVGA